MHVPTPSNARLCYPLVIMIATASSVTAVAPVQRSRMVQFGGGSGVYIPPSLSVPEEDAAVVLIGMMLPFNVALLERRIGFASSAGACVAALKRIEEEQLLPDVIWRVWDCLQVYTSRVNVIIGPPCSLAAVVAGMFGAYFNTPVVSWAANAAALSDRKRFPTFARTVPGLNTLSTAVWNLIHKFQWDEIGMIHNDDKLFSECINFKDALETTINSRTDFAVTIKTQQGIEGVMPRLSVVEKFLQSVKKSARIVIACLDNTEARRLLMLTAARMNMTTDEYLVDPWEPHEWRSQSCLDCNPSDDLDVYSAYRRVLMVQLHQSSASSNGQNSEFETFLRNVPKFVHQPPFNYEGPTSTIKASIYSPALYDALYMYALAVNRSTEAILSDSGTQRTWANVKEAMQRALVDGRGIVQTMMNLTFEGIAGKVWLDEMATKRARYVLQRLTEAGAKKSASFDDVGFVTFTSSTAANVEIPSIEGVFAHYGGKTPSSQPKCGWYGEKCANIEQDYTAIYVLGVVAAAVAFVCVVPIFLLVWSRRRDVSSEWQVKPYEITKITLHKEEKAEQVSSRFRPFEPRLVRGAKALVYFHGGDVAVLSSSKISYSEMAHMLRLTHENLVPFFGLAISQKQGLISCWDQPRNGNLLRVFQIEHIRIDWPFKRSLINDICEGLSFIHAKTTLGSHGRLSSTTCLLTDRWQVRIAMYGLSSAKSAKCIDDKDLLWTAPELLNGNEVGTHVQEALQRAAKPFVSVKVHPDKEVEIEKDNPRLKWLKHNEGPMGVNVPPTGSKPGDIYSLGIIMWEIIAKKRAYGVKESDEATAKREIRSIFKRYIEIVYGPTH